MNRIGSTFALAFLATSAFGVQAGAAQSYLMPDAPEKGIWIEASHPNIKTPLEVTAPSSAWLVAGRYPLMARLSGVAEVPFAYGRLDVSGADGSTVLGNPYLGLEYDVSERVIVELGARAPLTTADEDSFGDVVGFLADPLRGEAFMMDAVPLAGGVTFKHALPVGARLRARGGVTSVIYTGDDDEVDSTTTFLDYGVFGMYPVGTARFGAGVSGRWDVSEAGGDFSDNSLHQLGLSADALVLDRIRPGISLKVPLDSSQRDLVGSSIGLYVQVALP